MTTPITPASPPTIATSLVGPSDGESANALSVNSVFQDLEDDVESFRLLLYGGSIRRRVRGVGNGAAGLLIQPIGAVVVKSSLGVWTVFSNTTLNSLNPTTLTGGLAASTRYWVYGYELAGALSFTASTTAPDIGLKYMTGSETHMYITTFITDGSSNVVTYSQSDNVYTYIEPKSPPGAGGNLILSGGNAVVVTTVPLGYSVPSQAEAATLRVWLVPAADDTATLAQVGSTTSFNFSAYNTFGTMGEVHFGIGSVASFDYTVGINTSAFSVWAMGFVL